MTARAHTYAAVLLTAGAALLVPQLGFASSGGASLSGGGSTGTSNQRPSGSGTVQPGKRTVRASGNGITVVTHAVAMLHNQLRFTGRVASAGAGSTVEIERLAGQANGTWTPSASGRVRRDGTFSATWSASHSGRFVIRAVVRGGRAPRATPAASPILTVTVYKVAIATLYGPGFYGTRTACGQKLTRRTLGTANRTLKCGTRVSIYYHGRSIVVPVIDRGPYANGADWDLTTRTGQLLGMNGTGRVGAAAVPK